MKTSTDIPTILVWIPMLRRIVYIQHICIYSTYCNALQCISLQIRCTATIKSKVWIWLEIVDDNKIWYGAGSLSDRNTFLRHSSVYVIVGEMMLDNYSLPISSPHPTGWLPVKKAHRCMRKAHAGLHDHVNKSACLSSWYVSIDLIGQYLIQERIPTKVN